MLRVFLRFCVLLLTLSLPVHQNSHVDSVDPVFAISFIAVDVYFGFGVPPLLSFLKPKENICSGEFLMLLMEALILSLSRINKHTLSMGIYQLVREKQIIIMPPRSANRQEPGK